MPTGPGDLDHLAELERKLALLGAQRALNDAADEALEEAMRERNSLEDAVDVLLPILAEHTGARAALLRTFDETLALRDFLFDSSRGPFVSTTWPLSTDEIRQLTRNHQFITRAVDGHTIIAQGLDVAGQDFGSAAVLFDGDLDDEAAERASLLLDTWCEELDNYLAAIALARRKEEITRAISNALKEPVLDRGIAEAVKVLQEHVAFDHLVLAFRSGQAKPREILHYHIIRDGHLSYDSEHPPPAAVDRQLSESARRWIAGDRSWLNDFGIVRFCEEVMIQGVRDERVVGRLLLARRSGREFHTFDRDIIERFSDFLRMRIVDFNREWKQLSLCFPPRIATRLLAENDYLERFLSPREREVAVLFSDITGFTRLSEQVLRAPAAIGRLIDTWSSRAVEIIWETGGVFDKMVGDCVIGLWGPPFYELDAEAACRRAAEAARRIRDHTRGLVAQAGLEVLRALERPMGVATSLHYTRMCVGYFGPNENFTGFSAGMNATARLQGVAERDEILCMDDFVAAFGDPNAFGEERSAKVKNVAHAIRFRPLVQ